MKPIKMTPLPFTATELPTIHKPTKGQFLKLVKSARPFKVTGAMDNSPLYQKLAELNDPLYQCQYLAELLPREKIRYDRTRPEHKGVFGLDQKLKFTAVHKIALFPAFIEEVKKRLNRPEEGPVYLAGTEIKALSQRLGMPDFFGGFHPAGPFFTFWIGSGNQVASLHNDPLRNVIALLAGQKRLVVFPPESLADLYIAPIDRRGAGVLHSLVNVLKPNFRKFPRFRQALENARTAIINPGDIVYLPPLWWHHVEGYGFNVGANRWFYDDNNPRKIKVPLTALVSPAVRLLIALSDKPKHTREAARASFLSALETDARIAAKGDPLQKLAIKKAATFKGIIEAGKLHASQKEIWFRWIRTYMDWCVFREEENPFPSCAGNEFRNMVKRLRRMERAHPRWKYFP
jgi:hypothetical protein